GSTNAMEMFHEIDRVASTGVGGIVLWPLRALVALPIAKTPSAFVHALPAVLALLALHYVWVIATDTAFEERAAARAEKLGGRRSAPRIISAKAAPAPFALSPLGRPETAILWKNLILLSRYVSLRILVRIAILVVVLLFSLGRAGKGGPASFGATM